jgi:hypothetical protein
MRSISGTPSTQARAIVGDACEEVVESLALMVALVFDPAAAQEARSTPEAEPESPASRDDAAPGAVPASPPRTRLQTTAGVQGGVFVVGGLAWTLGGFADFAAARPARSGWLPSWRVGATLARLEDSAAGPAVRGQVTWVMLQLDGCPWSGAIADRVALRPCASLQGGGVVVSASGDGVRDTRAIATPWLAPGALLRVTWSPGAMLVLGVDIAGFVPLWRDTFAVDPSVTLFRAPQAALSASAALGAHFL